LKKIFPLLLITTTLLTLHLYAKDSSKDWTILKNGLGSIIEVYDNEKASKVIEFSSHSNRDTYINGAKKGRRAWNNKISKTIQFNLIAT
jgi:hypothetical protein